MNNKNTIILERCYVPQDGLVMRQDDSANCAYLIQSGSVGVYAEKNGKEIELARLGVGDIFGEMALVYDDVRTANVRALEDCNFIIITRQTFMEKLRKSDPTIKAVVEMLVKRVIKLNNEITNSKGDVEHLINVTDTIYNDILSRLEDDKDIKQFEMRVQPKLEAFISSLKPFRESE